MTIEPLGPAQGYARTAPRAMTANGRRTVAAIAAPAIFNSVPQSRQRNG